MSETGSHANGHLPPVPAEALAASEALMEEQQEVAQEYLPEFHPDKIRVAGGFMLRLPALIVDAVVVSLLGGVLQGALRPRLEGMEPWAWTAGFVLTFGYLFLMSSPLAGGRSLGKRLLQLYLVDKNLKPPGWGAAAVRGLLLATLLFHQPLADQAGLSLSPAHGLLVLLTLMTVAAWLLNGSMMDPLKQAWHDRLLGLYVIQREGVERFGSGAWHNEIWSQKGRLRPFMSRLALAVAIGYTLLLSGFFLPFFPRDKNGFIRMGPFTVTPQGTAVTRYLYWRNQPAAPRLHALALGQTGVLRSELFFVGLRGGVRQPTRRVWLWRVRVRQGDFARQSYRRELFKDLRLQATLVLAQSPQVDGVTLALAGGPNLGISANLSQDCLFEKPLYQKGRWRLLKPVFTQQFCLGSPVKAVPSQGMR